LGIKAVFPHDLSSCFTNSWTWSEAGSRNVHKVIYWKPRVGIGCVKSSALPRTRMVRMSLNTFGSPLMLQWQDVAIDFGPSAFNNNGQLSSKLNFD
jgi:hypothetical protein